MSAKRSRRRALARALPGPLAALAVAWLGACAGPVAGLWPPASGEPTHRIVVSIDTWHTVIGLWPPLDRSGADMAGLEEWSYADKAFYLEGDNGFCGALAAILWPSTGVIQVTRQGRPWNERTPQPPARQWSFTLSDEGYDKLRAHLESEKSPREALQRHGALWFDSQASYHGLHHCHHWAARALRSAGLPVWSFYAPFKWCLEAQLDRAMGFVEEEAGSRGSKGPDCRPP